MARRPKPRKRRLQDRRKRRRPVRRSKGTAAGPRRKRAAKARRRTPKRRQTAGRRLVRRARPARRAKRARRQVRRGRRHAAPSRAGRTPLLDRSRRLLPEPERLEAARAPDDQARLLSSARAGHAEINAHLARHNETSPVLTAGDIDAKWEDAYAVGDEAPGGDNPTPDQDRVDDIGKALGVQYRTDEELRGGDEITQRDKHRWELDPASSEDWPHKD